MKFEKGNKLSKGKPKGTLDKNTVEIKTVINKMVQWINDPVRFEEMMINVMESQPHVLVNFLAKIAPKDINLNTDAPKNNPMLENMIKIRKELEAKRDQPKIIEIKKDKL